jgi:hypothetical protein
LNRFSSWTTAPLNPSRADSPRRQQLDASFKAGIFCRLQHRPGWSLALSINGAGAAAVVISDTRRAGWRRCAGQRQLFGIDADGELYIVNYSSGSVLKIIQLPAAPTGLRILQ